jgi:hypothetical protein
MKSESWFSRFEEAIISALSSGDKPVERVYWVGRDTDGRRYILTDTGGGRWVLKVSGGSKENPYTGRQIEQTEDKDKLLFAAKDAPRGWLEMARGRWIPA